MSFPPHNAVVHTLEVGCGDKNLSHYQEDRKYLKKILVPYYR